MGRSVTSNAPVSVAVEKDGSGARALRAVVNRGERFAFSSVAGLPDVPFLF
jgi:hypothetical protein